MKQVVSRVDDLEYEKFKELTASLGTTASDVVRMFIYSFNDYGGFPYPVRKLKAEPFKTEEEALDFVSARFKEALDETW